MRFFGNWGSPYCPNEAPRVLKPPGDMREGSQKISLVDGPKLASLMIDFGVGVFTAKRYELKKLDSDYFEES